MKSVLAIIASLACVAANANALQHLTRTEVDPSVMRFDMNERKRVVNPFTRFFNGGETNATFMFWIECDRVKWWKGSALMRSLHVESAVSLDAARSTKEGGASLTNLLDGCAGYSGYDVPLTLNNGTWAASDVLYPIWPVGSRETYAKWPYGAYCVNLVTDSALVLTVGGTVVNVGYAANGRWVTNSFNVVAKDASQSVVLTASSENARVQLGVARMVPVEFGTMACTQPVSATGAIVQGQCVTNEWAMLAFRVGILPSGVVTSRCDLLTWYNHVDCGGKSWTPKFMRDSFEKDARFFVNVFTLNGGVSNDCVNVWGSKSTSGWLTDASIETIRDKDVEEMERRGMSRYWTAQ